MPDSVPVLIQTSKEGEPVRVSISTYGGEPKIDIRHMWSPDGPGGDLAFTKKGVSLPIEKGEELVAAISKIIAEYQ
jgi:hypothetical protein